MKKKHEAGNAKERIVETATQHFSEKGFIGSTMNEIAEAAEVNKALIYYYFPSKQTILDHIIEEFFHDVLSMGLSFAHDTMIAMIQNGSLDIMPDRMRFSTSEDVKQFKEKIFAYYSNILAYLMDKRAVLRIILSEALRGGDQHNALFRFFVMASESNEENPIFASISAADPDFTYSKDVVFRKFFFTLMPMINFVVFHDDYKASSGMDDGEMMHAYLRSLDVQYASYFDGQDIMMDPSEHWSLTPRKLV